MGTGGGGMVKGGGRRGLGWFVFPFDCKYLPLSGRGGWILVSHTYKNEHFWDSEYFGIRKPCSRAEFDKWFAGYDVCITSLPGQLTAGGTVWHLSGLCICIACVCVCTLFRSLGEEVTAGCMWTAGRRLWIGRKRGSRSASGLVFRDDLLWEISKFLQRLELSESSDYNLLFVSLICCGL